MRRAWPTTGRAGQVRSAVSFARNVRANLADVVRNQAVLAQAAAVQELHLLSKPCADPPLVSRVCRQADFGLEYADWMARLGEETLPLSRKAWEYAAICRALDAAGALQPGKRGLGFGVGREPLVSAFASMQIDVLATDLPAADPRAAGWSRTNQHARRTDELYRPPCPPDRFEQHVTLRAVDMNAIPPELTGFDFLWSSCALEHLGRLEAGAAFVQRAMGCLAPGGIAVHTTEFNVDSDDDTIRSGDTVAYRAGDLVRLLEDLRSEGHHAEGFLVGERDGVLDHITDVPPFTYAALLVRLGRFRVVPALIVVRAGAPGI